jgi:Short C-terminal domain
MATPQENEIAKLKHLHETGALTAEEFEAQKQAVMAQPRRRSIGDNAGVRALLPVGRSGLAIAAGYVGLVSFLVWPAALAAIILGILAIRDIKRNEGKHGMGRAIFALIAGGIVIVGFLVLMISTAFG